MKKYLPVFLMLVFSVYGCKPIEVTNAVNTSEPAGDYETFYWMPGIEKQVGELQGFIEKEHMIRLESKLAQEMILKGFRIDKENPDVLVNIEIIDTENRQPEQAAKAGYAYWNSYQPKNFPAGSMIIELINADRKKIFWQGAAADFLHEKPKKNNRKLEDAISTVFKTYQNKLFM